MNRLATVRTEVTEAWAGIYLRPRSGLLDLTRGVVCVLISGCTLAATPADLEVRLRGLVACLRSDGALTGLSIPNCSDDELMAPFAANRRREGALVIATPIRTIDADALTQT